MTAETRQTNGSVAAPYAEHLIMTAIRQGVSKACLQAATALDIEHLPHTISATDYLQLFSAADRFQPGIGVAVGKGVSPGAYPTLGLTLLSCETLAQTLEQVILFESLVHDLGTTRLEEMGDQVALIWQPNSAYFPEPDCDACRPIVESVFAGIKSFAEWLTGEALVPLSVELTYAKPSYETFELEAGCPIKYECRQNKVVTDRAVLKRRVIAGDSSLYPVVRAHAESVKAAQLKGTLSRQVKRFLVTHLPKKNVAIEAAAAYCCVSVRTLQRKLKEEATNYQAMVDETRYQLAAYYLTSTQLTLEQIADQVGFQETTSFYHAFKQWSGYTPNNYRQANQHHRNA